MKSKSYDTIIIGGGPGGYSAAIHAANSGLTVALFEKENIGGMCMNWGCIPSKTLLNSANIFSQLKDNTFKELQGINAKNLNINWRELVKKAMKNSFEARNNISLILKKLNVTIINGEAFPEKDKIVCKNTTYFYKHLILATGSIYPFIGSDNLTRNKTFNPKSIYNIKEVPKTITIIGAGIIGIEFSTLFSKLGCQVTLIDRCDELMPYIDCDLTKQLKQLIRENKVNLRLSTEAMYFDNHHLVVKTKSVTKKIKSDIYLSALPRQANTDSLSKLVYKGLALTPNGFVKTDLQCRTSLPNIYAIGDLNGQIMLAHIAAKEGISVINTILDKGVDLNYDFLPYNMYTSPEFSSIGLTEQKAIAQGFIIEKRFYPFTLNGKFQAENKHKGLIKIIYDKTSNEVLGVHIVSDNATDLINEAYISLENGATLDELENLTHAHPTLSDGMVKHLIP